MHRPRPKRRAASALLSFLTALSLLLTPWPQSDILPLATQVPAPVEAQQSITNAADPLAVLFARVNAASFTGSSAGLYALQGNGTTQFYRYDIAGDNWTTLAPTPDEINQGGSLAYDGTYLYALRGNGTTQFTGLHNPWFRRGMRIYLPGDIDRSTAATTVYPFASSVAHSDAWATSGKAMSLTHRGSE